MPGFEAEALSLFLQDRHKPFFGRAMELRETAASWLAYVPQTFPHYTQHTIEHSEEIIRQISQLLFRSGQPTQPLLDLSPVECYILIACAFLHDAGMVVSDQEKASILASDPWRSWTTGDGPAAERWAKIQALHSSLGIPDQGTAHFLADVQSRHLIAEFVRKHHHHRSADLLIGHAGALAGFSFGDGILLRTIADVCVSHGLQGWELADDARFPSRRDILGEQANVRLLAILLRLGDLLDMRSDRACPLLLNASSPLPTDSLAHWTQYQRLIHRLTAPDVIEIHAECDTPDEHRYIHDWYRWIAAEVQGARDLASAFTRHVGWQPPRADLRGPSATLIVRPSTRATYVPVDWSFKMDDEQVLNRLIHDLHAAPFSFLRELIQNSLDATRCKMYQDLASNGRPLPQFPTGAPKEVRDSYPITVRLEPTSFPNALSGLTEARQQLVVEDFGTGMDVHVITDYFLQIGRSYYRTEEFRRSFPFTPTSRFGLGFLSVFAVSDNVIVETWNPHSPTKDPPLRLSLTGPRTYILAEKADKSVSGTRVTVILHDNIPQGSVTSFLQQLCPMVEFPLLVEDLGANSTIRPEDPSQFLVETPDVTREGAYFTTRAFPVNIPGIEGFIYIFAHVTPEGESWGRWAWAYHTYPDLHPSASRHPFPPPVTCLHGVSIAHPSPYSHYRDGPLSVRLDFRISTYLPDLPRNALFGRGPGHRYVPELASRLSELLDEHFAHTPLALGGDRWMYIQSVSRYFDLPEYWDRSEMSLRAFLGGDQHLISLAQVRSADTFTVILGDAPRPADPRPAHDNEFITFYSSDFSRVADYSHLNMFRGRQPRNARFLASGSLALDWRINADPGRPLSEGHRKPVYLIALPSGTGPGIEIYQTIDTVYRAVLMNSDDPFVIWLITAFDACHARQHGLKPSQAERLIDLTIDAIRHFMTEPLNAYLGAWKTLPGLPAPLIPPDFPNPHGSLRFHTRKS